MKKRKIKSILWACGALLVIGLLVAIPFLMEMRSNAVHKGPSILNARAEKADIHSNLCGTGTLLQQEAFTVDVPEGVKITELLVENAQSVEEGQALAKVDTLSVMQSITQVQDTLQTLNEQIETASDQAARTEISAVTGGRLMKLYCEPGDGVQNVMLEHGALAIVSLDGMLEVRFETDAKVSTGDAVSVRLSDGTKLEGRVDASLAGNVSVTVSDELAPFGDSVQVADSSGASIGSGTLHAHSEWRATAYTGTVDGVEADEGALIRAGETILTLKDTGDSADFQRLSAKHRVYEEILTELFRLYQEKTVYAAHGGLITLPDDTDSYLLSAGGEGYALRFLVNAPTGDDETGYINFAGLVTGKGENGLEISLRPMPLTVSDYLSIEVDKAEMTVPSANPIPQETPVFYQEDGSWVQAKLEDLGVGDVLLFAYTMASPDPVWIVRIEKGEEASDDEPPEPVPEDPGQKPETPNVPDNPSPYPNLPFDPSAYPNLPSNYMDLLPGGYAGLIGGQPDYGSFAQSGLYAQYAGTPMEQEVKTLYSEARTELMTITPVDEMTLEISLDEQDILLAQPGQSADVTLDALPGRTFPAVVTEIDPNGVNSGGSSKFRVILRLARTEGMLGGMNAQALIPLETFTDVLTIPVDALVERGGRTYIYRAYDQRDGLLDLTEISTGVSDGQRVEVLSGLRENDPVWYEYYDEMEISNKVDTGPTGYFH